MKRKRFSEEQILAILKELDAGAIGKEVCRRHGISEQTLYRWKAKFGGLSLIDAKRLKQLEGENAKLKKLVADLTLTRKRCGSCCQKTSEARGQAPCGSVPHGELPDE
jgi:putative transposase